MKQFLQAVSDKIKDHDEFYVFGPAETKTSLKKHIEDDRNLASKLKAVEAADSMTLNQVTAKVKDYFK